MQMGDTRLKGWAAGGAGTLSGQGEREGGVRVGGREGGGRDVSEGLSMDVMMADR